MPDIVTQNIELIEKVYRGFDQQDVQMVLDVLDENIEWNEAEGTYWHADSPYIGHQAILDGVFAKIAEDFDDMRVIPDRIVGLGKTVIMQGRYQAKSCRRTGRPLDAQVVHVWDLHDGKAFRFQQYVDSYHVSETMGLNTVQHPN
ncbi:nuclear transport factor 2 family protein [Rhodococcus erythropolis]|uniref:nuclear transport factor 2 family protein n=1 Tax=Rhodococcus erythropolis TaxID=1833 RepID=UPI002227B348|nr:nuclear transport factor 2 family protein [Rhodococcus erythropolis]MCW2295366.1 ketosteroid isomerase-like protein [Rhodococcus erythropolis]